MVIMVVMMVVGLTTTILIAMSHTIMVLMVHMALMVLMVCLALMISCGEATQIPVSLRMAIPGMFLSIVSMGARTTTTALRLDFLTGPLSQPNLRVFASFEARFERFFRRLRSKSCFKMSGF